MVAVASLRLSAVLAVVLFLAIAGTTSARGQCPTGHGTNQFSKRTRGATLTDRTIERLAGLGPGRSRGRAAGLISLVGTCAMRSGHAGMFAGFVARASSPAVPRTSSSAWGRLAPRTCTTEGR
jgi:hypothetical protein